MRASGPGAAAATSFYILALATGVIFVAGFEPNSPGSVPALVLGLAFIAWAVIGLYCLRKSAIESDEIGILYHRAILPDRLWPRQVIDRIYVGSPRSGRGLLQVVIVSRGKEFRPAILQDFPTQAGRERLVESVAYLRGDMPS